MSAIVEIGAQLGALGIREIAKTEKGGQVLKYGLSFICSDEGLLDRLVDDNAEILDGLDIVTKKVDLLLSEAQSTCMQLLR